jgi:hypothetical protein
MNYRIGGINQLRQLKLKNYESDLSVDSQQFAERPACGFKVDLHSRRP